MSEDRIEDRIEEKKKPGPKPKPKQLVFVNGKTRFKAELNGYDKDGCLQRPYDSSEEAYIMPAKGTPFEGLTTVGHEKDWEQDRVHPHKDVEIKEVYYTEHRKKDGSVLKIPVVSICCKTNIPIKGRDKLFLDKVRYKDNVPTDVDGNKTKPYLVVE